MSVEVNVGESRCTIQAERELRAKLDNAFDSFRKKVESQQQYHIDFEKPFRELA